MHTANSFPHIRSFVFLYCLILQSGGVLGSAKGGMSRRRTRQVAMTVHPPDNRQCNNLHSGLLRDFEALYSATQKIHRQLSRENVFSHATSIIHFSSRELYPNTPCRRSQNWGISEENPFIHMIGDWEDISVS